MLNERDPNVDRLMGEFDTAMWFQSKCRDKLGPVYLDYAVSAATDAGLTSVVADTFDLGLQIGVMGEKDGKRHAGRFHTHSAVIADIWNWAKAL